MSIVLRNLRDQLDVFLTDLGVLLLVRVANVFAIDQEHRNLDFAGDAFGQFFFVFKLLVHVVTDHTWGGGDLAFSLFAELCNIFIWVEVVLGIKRSISLNILYKWQDGPLQVCNKVLECVVEPSVLVQKLSFVVRIRWKGLIRWNYRCLNCTKDLSLEKLFEKHLLKMRYFLQTLDTVFEDLLYLCDNLLGIVIVLGYQLVCLANQVELKQGIRVLVLRELLVDSPLNLNRPGEIITMDRDIAVRLVPIFIYLFLVFSVSLREFVSND